MGNRVYKLKPDTKDLRDKVYQSVHLPFVTTLPKEVDLRNGCSPIVDQGQLGSCTANAIASGLREYWEVKEGKLTLLSRLWLYWNERKLEGTIDQDAGASIRDGMKVLQKLGCAPEPDWPYDISMYSERPPEKSFADAALFKIHEYHRVTHLLALKAALAEGYPVVLGMMIYESFESDEVAANGIVSLPKRGEQFLGGHAVLAVGYRDDPNHRGQGYVVCRNSWGEHWGDKGYFYLPYNYFLNYVSDMWTGK